MTVYFAVATLLGGILVGYLAQRSGMCLVSGVRDFYMVRDTHLIKAIPGLFAGALGSYFIYSRIAGFTPNFPLFWDISSWITCILIIIGAFGLGFFTVFADGCPNKQFVRASEGRKDALAYLAGFFVGIAYFNLVLGQVITTLIAVLA